MSDILRDSTFGQLARLVTGGKVFKYPEERDESFYQKYINSEKSANLARTGTASDPPPKDAEKDSNDGEPNASSTSSDTEVDKDLPINEASGVKVDPEKGRDIHIVDWYGDNDPEVSLFQDHGLVVPC